MMETPISVDEHSVGLVFKHPTETSVSSRGGRWNVFGNEVPKEEIVFFTQVLLIYVIAITSIVNLSLEAKNDTLWTSLLSASLGYMLPAPQMTSRKKKQI